ncbi:Ig-like domain-containing protein, partial [Dysosmobacter sp.]|uniref:Ig-like domain-containing protein n=1 Tax=Dysosmobacter sp. TaxID=2591382 RepID=UPI003AB89791
EDVSCVVESSEYMTLTVEVTGTPAPALQWQVSRDGGKTWENIEGATEATYQALLPLSLHGAKFRCAATNKDGTTYSHTFTAYYCPAVLRGAASPMRGNGEFIQGEIATITAGFYDGQTRYPISSLTGVTAEYRWKYCRNVMPTEEEWAKIPPAGESYPITITDEMDYQCVCFHVTLTYPGNTVKTVTGYWRLLVCVTPVVTEQPQSVSAAVGDSVTFSAKLIKQNLNTLEYQWQSSTDGGQSWTDIEGAGGKSYMEDDWNYIPSYTIPSVTAAQSGQLFRCVLWNTNNHTGSDRVSTPPVYSEPATLTVTPPAHEHRYGDWSKDGTNHWHECTDADCPEQSESIKDKAAHIYDDDADTTCNVCGYVRTVTPEAVPVSQITLNKTETSISVGNSETLTATVAPENAANKALNWASSDTSVATVAPDGTVTAVKAGTATITATAEDGSGKSATCTVTVTGDTTPPAHEHRYGDWSHDAANHWHECTDAACPNQSESIKDKAAHVYTDDADTTCNVCGYVRTVTPETVPVSQITLNKAETSISVGNSETLTATVTPGNAANKALNWASSDEDVAIVAADGTVTAVKAGAATITATAADGSGKSAVCKVTVTGDTTPSQPGGSTGGSSGGSSSGGGGGSSSTTPTKPETATKPDGTKVETVTKPDGTKVETTTGKDDSVTKTETKAETKPDGTKTETKSETVTNKDGSKVESETRTETKKDGTVTESKTETITSKDGTKSETKSETKTDKNGVTFGTETTKTTTANGSTGMTVTTIENGESKTAAEAKVSSKAVEDAKKNGEAVKAPVEVEASRNSNTAPTVKVELPKGAGETKVEIPVSNATPGTVAVLVHPDGTEEIVKNSVPTENGIQLTVDGSATVKIIDNSKGFIDTQDHWAKDAIDFVSARGLVNGMSATIYAPNNSTTRAQLWTILARQNDAELTGGATWYEKAQNWAKAKGISDGANPNADINRAQMVTMLWRAEGQPAAGGAASFTDVSADSYYAGAVSWAIENGITTGVGGGKFDPTATCTRAQIAAFLARSMK